MKKIGKLLTKEEVRTLRAEILPSDRPDRIVIFLPLKPNRRAGRKFLIAPDGATVPAAESSHALSGGLDEHEKISVRALIAYAAMNTGKPEEEIGRRVCERFAAANFDHLPSRAYEDVIRFLVDLCDGGAQ